MKIYILVEVDSGSLSHIVDVFPTLEAAEESQYAFESVYGRGFAIVTKEMDFDTENTSST